MTIHRLINEHSPFHSSVYQMTICFASLGKSCSYIAAGFWKRENSSLYWLILGSVLLAFFVCLFVLLLLFFCFVCCCCCCRCCCFGQHFGVFGQRFCWCLLASVLLAFFGQRICCCHLDSVFAGVFGHHFAAVFGQRACLCLWAAFCWCLLGSVLLVSLGSILLLSYGQHAACLLDSVFAGVFGQRVCWRLWTAFLLVSLDSVFAGVFGQQFCWCLLDSVLLASFGVVRKDKTCRGPWGEQTRFEDSVRHKPGAMAVVRMNSTCCRSVKRTNSSWKQCKTYTRCCSCGQNRVCLLQVNEVNKLVLKTQTSETWCCICGQNSLHAPGQWSAQTRPGAISVVRTVFLLQDSEVNKLVLTWCCGCGQNNLQARPGAVTVVRT